MSPVSPELEIAGPADADALAELHYLSHTVSFADFASAEWLRNRDRSEYVEQWDRFLQAAAQEARSQAWKVTIDERVVGMVKVSPASDPASDGEAHLSSMHVDPDFQRRGIGTALMNAAVQFVRNAGFSKATLGVIQANAPARAIYERSGWSVQELHPTGIEGVPIAVYTLKI